MKVKVKMNASKVAQLKLAQVVALEQTAAAVFVDVLADNVIPFDINTLQESTFVDKSKSATGKVSIVSDQPYARKMYFHPEYNFNQTNNPNAKGRWYDDWIDGSKKNFAPNIYKETYKRLTGI